ncbi:DegT/DnrJ/EryC1/StrS family aminotransferase [Chitiniphilus shinanonensis]|uniref:DegT/DnrJ/EryC1/StrS family aminotransferase n=1 Tax=Chitiniphilus shinanonensis TaxID=553088 RepID=UPI0030365E16
MLNTKFSPWPSFTEEEILAVTAVLKSNKVNYWTGTECRSFEREFAEYLGCKYAVALANGTLAIDLALKVLDIGPGDEVIVTSRTFIASASCIVTAGATPVFADISPDTQNITADTIRAVLTPRTKAIICVHLAGWPCDMDPIMALARERGIFVVEDCAQAHGAQYKGRHVGTIGDIGAWSFCQDKIMTTGGEGGMVTTNDKRLWSAMWSYKDHGKSWEAVYEREHPPGFRWVHDSFGTNWRMLEMQAAIGRLQLKRLDEWRSRRQYLSSEIERTAHSFPLIRKIAVPDDIVHARYKQYLFIEKEWLEPGWSRDRIIEELVLQGIPCYQGSCSEVYLEKAFDNTPWRPESRLPVAQMLGETALMFLVHPTLKDEEIEMTCKALEDVLHRATRKN